MPGKTRRALKADISRRTTEARRNRFTTVVDDQNGLCWFCGEWMGVDCTKEHLEATARGGPDVRSNWRAAHSECNSAAGHLSVEDKHRLREIGHAEGRAAMISMALQLRRADARMAFSPPQPGWTPRPPRRKRQCGHRNPRTYESFERGVRTRRCEVCKGVVHDKNFDDPGF